MEPGILSGRINGAIRVSQNGYAQSAWPDGIGYPLGSNTRFHQVIRILPIQAWPGAPSSRTEMPDCRDAEHHSLSGLDLGSPFRDDSVLSHPQRFLKTITLGSELGTQ